MNKDLNFDYGPNTRAYGGCAATLNGEMWYFGGTSTKPDMRRQVCMLHKIAYIFPKYLPYGSYSRYYH